MTRDIDEAAFEAAGLIYNRLDAETAEFWFVERPERVRVAIHNGKLEFVPRRSAGHRDVLSALGVVA
jgi:hypothetical protein